MALGDLCLAVSSVVIPAECGPYYGRKGNGGRRRLAHLGGGRLPVKTLSGGTRVFSRKNLERGGVLFWRKGT
ncbi:MAG TPA: hypothetical protein DDZ83_14130, partial [Nitrospinae bacterium]|nr:hypothetical protein [Nitrospinota bacterium]